MTGSYDVYLEVGRKKIFAVAVNWPGWCRFGKDEQQALEKLVNAAPRYMEIAHLADLAFTIPETTSQLNIVARVEGNATTDFGAPDIELPHDGDPLGVEELDRYERRLKACWLAFDRAVGQAEGKELLKGPRGGGRDVDKIIDHVLDAEEGYLQVLGWKPQPIAGETVGERQERVRKEVILGLRVSAGGQIPKEGPRGGKRWSPRFFVRRLAWHAVDHAWEIEDRIID